MEGERAAASAEAVRLIGYWREVLPEGGYPGMSPVHATAYERARQQGLRWPDPKVLVDDLWDPVERERVVRHLEVGTLVNQYRGISRCRFCGADNGSAELTDGVFCWPEGLPHYVREHGVRLPAAFVEHVGRCVGDHEALPPPVFGRLGHRDREWPGAALAGLLWQPARDELGHAYVAVDATWWLAQATD